MQTSNALKALSSPSPYSMAGQSESPDRPNISNTRYHGIHFLPYGTLGPIIRTGLGRALLVGSKALHFFRDRSVLPEDTAQLFRVHVRVCVRACVRA